MLLLAALSFAATVTEIPDFLRGDVGLRYAWDHTSGRLAERADPEIVVGDRSVDTHLMYYALTFAPGPGVAVFAEIPHYVSETVSYTEAQAMVYDPATGSGTYVGTDPLEPGTYVSGSGLDGVWLGVRATPFSEAFAARNNRATWRLELAYRTGSEHNLWSGGAGDGAPAVRLGSAFSTSVKSTQPYLTGALTWYTARDRALESGTVPVDPGNRLDLRTGAEFVAWQQAASGGEFRVDLHLALGYQAAGSIPSGYYLPSVLDDSVETGVQTSESLEGGAGLGLIWRPMTYLQLAVGGDLSYGVPRRIENVYPVYTGGDTLHTTFGTQLTVRIR